MKNLVNKLNQYQLAKKFKKFVFKYICVLFQNFFQLYLLSVLYRKHFLQKFKQLLQ